MTERTSEQVSVEKILERIREKLRREAGDHPGRKAEAETAIQMIQVCLNRSAELTASDLPWSSQMAGFNGAFATAMYAVLRYMAFTGDRSYVEMAEVMLTDVNDRVIKMVADSAGGTHYPSTEKH